MSDIYSLNLLKVGFCNFKTVSRKINDYETSKKTTVKQKPITRKIENSMLHGCQLFLQGVRTNFQQKKTNINRNDYAYVICLGGYECLVKKIVTNSSEEHATLRWMEVVLSLERFSSDVMVLLLENHRWPFYNRKHQSHLYAKEQRLFRTSFTDKLSENG